MIDYDLLVIGELNVDLILTGSDLAPGFGQAEKLVDDATLALGSSSAILACGAARLGLKVALAGKVGSDEFGRFVLNVLQARGVDTSPVRVDPEIKTGLTVHLSHPHDRAMLTYLGSIAAFQPHELDQSLFQRSRHVHLSSFFLQKSLQPALPGLFSAARKAGATTSLDPGWDPEEGWNGTLHRVLEWIDLFLPNEQEALAIGGGQDLDQALVPLAKRLPLIAVKLGSRGAMAQHGVQRAFCKGFSVTSVDTTGAGDSFNAGFLYGYLHGLDMADSLRWGCACGALSTTRVGGIEGQPGLAEVHQFLHQSEERKI